VLSDKETDVLNLITQVASVYFSTLPVFSHHK